MDIKEKLKLYLDQYLKPAKKSTFKEGTYANFVDYECCSENIDTFIKKNKDENTFQMKLFRLIDERGLKDAEVYNKVNIDRRLFSKIRGNKDYHPSKETVILFGLALDLNEEEIEDLLSSASYSLPMNTTFDLIIRFCFKEHIYDVDTVNNFLYDYNCKLLNE